MVKVIGKGSKPWVSLPKGNGIKLSIIEDGAQRKNRTVFDRFGRSRVQSLRLVQLLVVMVKQGLAMTVTVPMIMMMMMT